MVKQSYTNSSDQFDPKVFKESLGSFGTTTQPGANQLSELQAKIRQGVKHVELHLASKAKGQFNVQDVPDKYGFEQRRTIMQLAKLNQQTLSVHGTFDVVSLSGLGQSGFNEAERAVNIRELDETLKFAAETAKQGAVVFHIQGDSLSTSRSELNLSNEYLKWLEKNNPEEYKKLKKEYFSENPLQRKFVENPNLIEEVKLEYQKLSLDKKKGFEDLAKKDSTKQAWEHYYIDKNIDKLKLSPDVSPAVVVGDQVSRVDRNQEFVDIGRLRKNDFSKDEKDAFKKLDIDINNLSFLDVQRVNALFFGDYQGEVTSKLSQDEFTKLKSKLIVEYENLLKENNFMQAQTDVDFFKRQMKSQEEQLKLQKKDLEIKYKMNIDELSEVKKLEREAEQALKKLDSIKGNSIKDQEERDKLKQEIKEKNYRSLVIIQQSIGINEYQQLARYDEMIAKITGDIQQIENKSENVIALTEASFNKNAKGMGHLAIQALKHQLELKEKAKLGAVEKEKVLKHIDGLEKKYQTEQNQLERNKIEAELVKVRYRLKSLTGLKDYQDIDIIKNPLYLAPENMLPGYGSLTSLEEYKGVIRMAWQDFAERILSSEKEYVALREKYELETGIKIDSKDKAIQLAKRHLGGTFDNAHAGTWLKHFKKEEGETDEHRIQRFNVWLNEQAEQMTKEGIVKHFHFNDTQGKDDDHNLLGQGILNIHDLRERLRKAGVKEPLIIEAGGRGANAVLHLSNAFDIFSPSLMNSSSFTAKEGYAINTNPTGSGVSDWVSTRRLYEGRFQNQMYGFTYNTFKATPPQNKNIAGKWSGRSFL